MFGLLFESEPILRTGICRLIVSTVKTYDYGYETAILDKKGTHPVQRYLSLEESIIGHNKWVEHCKNGLIIIDKLDYMSSMVKTIYLERI